MEKRQITEKELKIAAKQCRMQVGVIDYLILKVRENQRNSQIKKFEFCHRLEYKYQNYKCIEQCEICKPIT
jgi:hypothetical protein